MSFANGFAAGSSMMRGVLEMKAAEDERERQRRLDDERRDREREMWKREDARNAEVNKAFGDHDRLMSGGVLDGATGLKPQSMQMLAAGGTAYGAGSQAAREATGDFAREGARMGLAPAYFPTADIQSRPASPLEVEQSLGRIATATRDVRGLRDSVSRQRTLREDELIAKAEVNEDTVKWLNQNHQSLTFMPADKDGFRQMSFVDVDGAGQLQRLSKADQKKLAGAQALFEVNPERAMAMVGEVNKGLADLFARENQLAEMSGRSGNDVANKRGALGLDRARLEELSRHNRMTEGIAARQSAAAEARANRENAAMQRLELGDQLGQEAAGYAEGLRRAQNLGAEGRDAANIYGERLSGVQQRMRGLGLNPGTDRERLSPKDELAAEAALIQAGMSPEQARARVTGYDPVQAMARMLQERGGGGTPTRAAAPPTRQPAPAPQFNPAVRAQQIQEALAADDAIKSGGLAGMGGRAMRAGRMPLGMGERRDMELELRQLVGGR